jgi:drug/metabolite transporter (DMT)-like permease
MVAHTSLAAGTYLFGKAATQHIPVLTLGFLRFALASALFLMLVRARRMDLAGPWRAARGQILAAGLLGVLLNQVGFLWGLKLTLPSHAALLYALTPTAVLLLAWMRGLERPSARKVGGIALAFLGVVVLFQGRGEQLPPSWLLGDLLVLLAVLAWAGYTVVSRPLVLRFGAERATALSILTGSVLFLPLGLASLPAFRPSEVPASAWMGALYLGVVASVVMYLLWFHALSLREPSRVAIAANGQPILTALLGWALLGQPVSLQFGAGAVLVITGVVLTQL